MIFYYIRHAEPIYNPDSITEFGKKQAESLANRLVIDKVDAIYSSSCNRAVMTASPACKKLGIKCVKLDFAREDQAWADFSLQRSDEHANWCFEYPDIVNMFLNDEVVALGANWYNHEMFKDYKFKEGLQRINKDVDEFFETLGYVHDRKNKEYKVVKTNDRKVVLVAHSGFGMAFLSSVLDIPYNVFSAHHKQMGTACITKIEFKENDGKCIPRLICYSDESHLYKDGLV